MDARWQKRLTESSGSLSDICARRNLYEAGYCRCV